MADQFEDSMSKCLDFLNTLEFGVREEIEAYLVCGYTVSITAHYECLIEGIFYERACLCGDTQVTNYVKCALQKKFRSPDLSKINDILKSFDPVYHKTFGERVTNTAHHVKWDNIMRARHSVVHGEQSLTMTLTELLPTYRESRRIVDELRMALELE